MNKGTLIIVRTDGAENVMSRTGDCDCSKVSVSCGR